MFNARPHHCFLHRVRRLHSRLTVIQRFRSFFLGLLINGTLNVWYHSGSQGGFSWNFWQLSQNKVTIPCLRKRISSKMCLAQQPKDVDQEGHKAKVLWTYVRIKAYNCLYIQLHTIACIQLWGNWQLRAPLLIFSVNVGSQKKPTSSTSIHSHLRVERVDISSSFFLNDGWASESPLTRLARRNRNHQLSLFFA